MKKITLDNIIFELQKSGGASVYWSQLASRLSQFKDFEIDFCTGKKIDRLFKVKNNSDIFHSSHFRISSSSKTKNVITVYDMIYELGMSNLGVGKIFNIFERKRAIYNSHGIICISKSTKDDLLKIYPEIAARCPIKVIHLAADHIFDNTPEIKVESQKIKKYANSVLFIGGRLNYKNFKNSLVGYYHSKLWQQGVNFICTGVPFNEIELSQIKDLKIDNYVYCLGLISPAEIQDLYKSAYCLLYTSLYEGFGIPILEAMQNRCPVIISNIPSSLEISGGAAEGVDGNNVYAIEKALISLQENYIREKLISSGSQRVKHFSWDNCVQQHVSFYKSL